MPLQGVRQGYKESDRGTRSQAGVQGVRQGYRESDRGIGSQTGVQGVKQGCMLQVESVQCREAGEQAGSCELQCIEAGEKAEVDCSEEKQANRQELIAVQRSRQTGREL